MDKALEIVMVASILIVASVVVLALLQNQSEGYGNFSRERAQSGDCGLGKLKFQRAIDCQASSSSSIEPGGAENIRENYENSCAWAADSSDAYDAAC